MTLDEEGPSFPQLPFPPITKAWKIRDSFCINTTTEPTLTSSSSVPSFHSCSTLSSLDSFKIISLISFQRRRWVSVCLQFFMPSRSSNCNLFLPEVSYLYHQQLKCQKATLQFMLEKLKRSGLWFRYLT